MGDAASVNPGRPKHNGSVCIFGKPSKAKEDDLLGRFCMNLKGKHDFMCGCKIYVEVSVIARKKVDANVCTRKMRTEQN